MGRNMRRNFLVKLGLFVVSLLLLGPYLFHLKLGEDSQESYKHFMDRKRSEDKDAYKQHKHGAVVHMVEEKEENIVPPPGDHEGPAGGDDVQGKTADIPKAFVTKGKIGNYEPKEPSPSHAPGENGDPVYTSMDEKSKSEQEIRQYGFNMVNSDKIAMNRTIPDTRLDECKYWNYPDKQPTASVILVFHNEGFSTLVRTVHSVINTSPKHMLKEVVMVDDFSDKENLKGHLEDYLKQFNGLVKLYRNKEREGLIRTRTRGAELSTGDVIVFLDAHCECNRNWLPPLLDRIRVDRKTMAVPIVDGIDWDNFQYRPVYSTVHHRGIFEWGFLYKESQVPKKELDKRAYNSEPYPSPTHAGGLFAMDRNYFFELGGYDPGLRIWGGENFELSFKIWQCGGRVEWVPCSRVGHIYRNFMPYSTGQHKEKIPVITLNYMRVVEVWLGEEFREYFYTREPMVRGYPIGDISKQVQFKKDNNCKSFKWFMDNVAYEVYDLYPLPPRNKAWGEFKQKRGNKCWDSMGQGMGGGPIGAYYCHHGGSNQYYRLNEKGQIGTGEWCLRTENGDTIHIRRCDVEPAGPWKWDENTGLIRNVDVDKCVDIGEDNLLHLKSCDPSAPTQLWDIKEIYPWKD
ncbi:N-acetylgalactosaminyltransferase 7-like [Littorina saxatilis]|uniref:Polypeptide N-acetylgalactosaminyltransferase n=1 Tax=Littorina saxatilis TaxID=31220 RepID=A0AAN9BFC1_9CAEN